MAGATAARAWRLVWADSGHLENRLSVPPLRTGQLEKWRHRQARVGPGCQTLYAFPAGRDLRVSDGNENKDPLGAGVHLDVSEAAPRCSRGRMHDQAGAPESAYPMPFTCIDSSPVRGTLDADEKTNANP